MLINARQHAPVSPQLLPPHPPTPTSHSPTSVSALGYLKTEAVLSHSWLPEVWLKMFSLQVALGSSIAMGQTW